MNKIVLITGGNGLVGKHLTKLLLQKGYKIHILSRNDHEQNIPDVKTFKWDVYKREIDKKCTNGVETIFHLAGEGIADKRWTDRRKKQIIESRTESIRLIYSLLKNDQSHTVKSVISASAIGYYSDRGNELMNEESKPSTDFMGNCCVKWEEAVDEGSDLDLRIVKMRTGIVFDQEDSALAQMAKPAKLGLGAALGPGKQWMSWIHIQDAVRMYTYAVENEAIKGVYNMVSPNPATNKNVSKAIAEALHKPFWLPHVPAFILKLAMGKMSTVVLGSTKASAQKILSAGFKFEYPELKSALKEIYD